MYSIHIIMTGSTGTEVDEAEAITPVLHEVIFTVTQTVKRIRLLFEAVRTAFIASRADEVLENNRGKSLGDTWNEIEQVGATISRTKLTACADAFMP